MKTYMSNYKLLLKMKRKQRRRHPNWEKTKSKRLKLWGISSAITIITAIYGYFTLNGILGFLFGGMGMFILASIPAAIYTIAIAEECENFIGRSRNEFIILDDKAISYAFQGSNDRGARVTVNELQYNRIKKIVYNKYHERIDIYGRTTQIYYNNYNTKEVIGYRHLSRKFKMRIYLYFNDCEDMLSEILKHTNITPEIIEYAEEN